MGLGDCEICWETHCVHQCPPHFRSGPVETVEMITTKRAKEMADHAVMEERGRILAIISDQATRYSKIVEAVAPSTVALVFANAVRSKIEGK